MKFKFLSISGVILHKPRSMQKSSTALVNISVFYMQTQVRRWHSWDKLSNLFQISF